MGTVVSSAPGAGTNPILNACERRSPVQNGTASTAGGPPLLPDAAHRAPEELWAGYGRRPSVIAWLSAHRLFVIAIVLGGLLLSAAILPALVTEDSPPLARTDFRGIGLPGSPGMIAATQLPGPDRRRGDHASRAPLSQLVPSSLPSGRAAATPTQGLLVGLDLPAGVTASVPGPGQEGQLSFRSLLLAFALAVFLVYLVTASQLKSLLNPLSILFTVPMGLIAAAWGLYATGATLNAVALIGTILLAGILVNNALVFIEAVRNARERGTRTRDAMIQASQSRVRTIMITGIGTVLGLLPMAIGVGEGLGIRRPMTITVIAGLAVATFLVAVAVPVLCAVLDRDRKSPARAAHFPRADKTV